MHGGRLSSFTDRTERPGAGWEDPPLILLVEGDGPTRLAIANDLLDEGFEVVEAEHATEAMSILGGRDDFAALITDMEIDGGPNGMNLLRHVSRTRPSVQLLILCGDREPLAEAETYSAIVLRKSRDRSGLIAAVLACLAPNRSAPA